MRVAYGVQQRVHSFFVIFVFQIHTNLYEPEAHIKSFYFYVRGLFCFLDENCVLRAKADAHRPVLVFFKVIFYFLNAHTTKERI